MARIDSRTVPAGGSVTIVVDHPKTRTGLAPPPADLHAPPDAAPYVSPIAVELYDMGVTYQEDFNATANETRSKYTEISLEVSNSLNATDRAQIRYYLLSNLTETHVAHSDRAISSAYRLQAGSSETDGTITTVKFEQGGTVYNGNPLGETQEWARRVPTDVRLADIDAIIASTPSSEPAQVKYSEKRLEAVKETWERWDVQSASRTGKDGTLRKRLTEGRWGVGIDSYVAYQPWLPWDSTHFKITTEPRASAPETKFPDAHVGFTESTRYRTFMAPQMVQWQARWTSLYFYGTLFSQGEFWLFAVTQWCDRLPFFPFAYQLSEVGTHANWTTMSRRVSQTLHYQALLALDRAVEVFSGFLIVLLEARLAGRWSVRFRSIAADTLCAKVEGYYNGSPFPVSRYIWRRTQLTRANDLIERGELDTAEVHGDDGGFPFVED